MLRTSFCVFQYLVSREVQIRTFCYWSNKSLSTSIEEMFSVEIPRDISEFMLAYNWYGLRKQVLQFYYWKAPELAAARSEAIQNSELPQPSFRFRTSADTEICLPCDRELAESTLGHSCYEEAKVFTDSNDLSLAVVAWENYSCKLRRDLLSLMPHWLSNQSIFFADPSELRMYNGWPNLGQKKGKIWQGT